MTTPAVYNAGFDACQFCQQCVKTPLTPEKNPLILFCSFDDEIQQNVSASADTSSRYRHRGRRANVFLIATANHFSRRIIRRTNTPCMLHAFRRWACRSSASAQTVLPHVSWAPLARQRIASCGLSSSPPHSVHRQCRQHWRHVLLY